MIPVALRFAYDGPSFPRGYARQPEGGTVEDALIAALRKQGYVDGSWKTGSRTDRGVSAAQNVAACTLDRPHLDGLVPALNAVLPDGVWATGAARVEPDWNPRHHAVRTYTYHAPRGDEELALMQDAAAAFVGRHDLSGFAKVEPHRNPVRDIDTCTVAADGDAWVFTVASPGFLWNQVRRMVDALLQVGTGRLSRSDIEAALASGAQHPRMDLAPAEGLLLASVRYEPEPKWDDDAGTLPAKHLERAWQAAQVRSALLDGLSGSS